MKPRAWNLLLSLAILLLPQCIHAQTIISPEEFDTMSTKMDMHQLERVVSRQLSGWEQTLQRADADLLATLAAYPAEQQEHYTHTFDLDGPQADSIFAGYVHGMIFGQEELIDHRHSVCNLFSGVKVPDAVTTLNNLNYRATKVFLKDSMPLALSSVFDERGALKLPTTRIADSMLLTVSYDRFAALRQLRLDTGHASVDAGKLYAVLKAMEGSSALLEVSDSLYQNLVKVEGLNAAGQSLESYSFASSYLPSGEILSQMERGIIALRQVQTNLKAGVYNTTDTAKAAIGSALRAGPATDAGDMYYRLAYGFMGKVTVLRLYYRTGRKEVQQQVMVRGMGKKRQQEDDPIDIRNR